MQTFRQRKDVSAWIAKKRVSGDKLVLTIKERKPNGAILVRDEEFAIPAAKRGQKGSERQKFIEECAVKALDGAKSAPKPQPSPKLETPKSDA